MTNRIFAYFLHKKTKGLGARNTSYLSTSYVANMNIYISNSYYILANILLLLLLYTFIFINIYLYYIIKLYYIPCSSRRYHAQYNKFYKKLCINVDRSFQIITRFLIHERILKIVIFTINAKLLQ